jgi:photosystem II stability/assembly factor-like uncharacterized protein
MTVHLATPEALYSVTGTADDPATTRGLAGTHPECVAVHPDEPDLVLAGTFEDGLHRSTDGGGDWRPVDDAALADASVTAVAVNPGDPDEWWAGTEPSAVYRSTDAGATWERREGLTDLPSASGWSFPPRPDTHHVRWVEVDPHDPAHLYVGIEAGALVQTRDRGATWTDRVPSSRRDNHTLATHPDAPGRAYSAAGDGYAETTDGGETWAHPQSGLDHRYCWGLAVDPGDPDTVLVSAATGASRAHRLSSADAYLYRRRGDADWERLDDAGIPTGEGVTRAVLAGGRAPGELFAAHDRGLYRTTDAGDSFERFDLDAPERTVRALAVV